MTETDETEFQRLTLSDQIKLYLVSTALIFISLKILEWAGQGAVVLDGEAAELEAATTTQPVLWPIPVVASLSVVFGLIIGIYVQRIRDTNSGDDE